MKPNPPEAPAPSRAFRYAWFVWIVAGVATAYLALYPLSTGMLRLALIALATTSWISLLILTFYCRRGLCIVLTAITAAALVFIALPGTASYDRFALRGEYTSALRRYQGVTYFWGGETPLGIDCSGLMRRGLIDACALYGIRTFNPRLLRTAFHLWLHDESAQEMGAGYLDLTHPAFPAPSLNAIDSNLLRPGDMAVAGNGIHVLAYMGNRTWIEADPSAGKVIQVSAPTASNPWFAIPVHVVRWAVLESNSPDFK